MGKRALPATHVRDKIVDVLMGFAGRDNFITIPVTFVKFCDGDLAIAALFSQILYWTGVTDDPEGWIAKSFEDWQDEICLTRTQLDRATRELAKVGLQVKKGRSRYHNFAPTIHYRFDREVLGKAANAFFADPVNGRQKMKGQRKNNLPKLNELDLLKISETETLSFNESDSLNVSESYKETIEKSIERLPISAATQTDSADASLADEADDDAMFPVSSKGSAATKSARADKAQKRLAQQTIPPTPLTPAPAVRKGKTAAAKSDKPAPAKKREKGSFARILDDAWKKGVSGYLLTMLVGTAKADRGLYHTWRLDGKRYNAGEETDDRPMTEAEVYAFGKWYKRAYPEANMPEKPEVVWQKIVGFRCDDRYEQFLDDATYDVQKIYHSAPVTPVEDADRPVASKEAQRALLEEAGTLFKRWSGGKTLTLKDDGDAQ